MNKAWCLYQICVEIFSITLIPIKHHLLDAVYQKPYIVHCYSFIGWYTLWCLNFLHFLSIRMLDLKSTVEIYVDVSTVENWLFCRLSCMLNKYSGNYWKNFKYKVTSIASKSQVTPSSSNGNYRRDVGCNLFDLRSEYA